MNVAATTGRAVEKLVPALEPAALAAVVETRIPTGRLNAFLGRRRGGEIRTRLL